MGLETWVSRHLDQGARPGYATALREFRGLAEQGNASAQFNLGVMYGKGHGVPQDYAEAARVDRNLRKVWD